MCKIHHCIFLFIQLDRLEDNIDAADKPVRQKPGKKANSLAGPILKEISSETQHLGKVTRFQLLGENCSYKHLPRSAPSVEIKTRRNDGNKVMRLACEQLIYSE